LILARNNPGRLAGRIRGTLRITHRLKSPPALIDVPILDYHIVGDGEGAPHLTARWPMRRRWSVNPA
jgi:DNA repair protein RadC